MWKHLINFFTFAWVLAFVALCGWCYLVYVNREVKHYCKTRERKCMYKAVKRMRMDVRILNQESCLRMNGNEFLRMNIEKHF